MNAAQRISAFAVGLVMVFVVASWVGKAIGPDGGAEMRQAPAQDDTHAAHGAASAERLAGLSRLFLDFQHAGVVRTAEFTMPIGDGEAS
jgi:hypothetical protein